MRFPIRKAAWENRRRLSQPPGCLLGRGYTVLVIDTDPQATASSYMVSDFEKQEEGREASLYHLIMDENLSVPDSIVHTPSGDLITASFLLYDMDRLGLGTSAIKEIVDEVRGQYDFILIDTPPNLRLAANSCAGSIG